MSVSGHDKAQLKLQRQGRKWWERFAQLVPEAASSCRACDAAAPPLSSCDGYVVLNGGVLAGCSPYEVRQALQNAKLLIDDHDDVSGGGDEDAVRHDRRLMYYSTKLPFVLVCQPLRVPQTDCDILRTVTLSTQPARHADATGGLPLAAPMLYALDMTKSPSQRRVVPQKACSSNNGCGTLFLLPCNTSRLLQGSLADHFQRPVLNLDELLAQRAHAGSDDACRAGCSSGTAADDKAAHEAQPRRLRCLAVREIPGLLCVPDFITVAEHDAIWHELHGQGRGQLARVEHLSRRHVAHFNRRFLYGVNRLGAVGEAVNANPSFFAWMRRRLHNDDDNAVHIDPPYPLTPRDPPCDQLTVNYYDYDGQGGGCGIAAHVDAHSPFGDYILVVSLGSYTVMDFAKPGQTMSGSALYGVYVPPRSLLVMSGEARYGWTHCIAERRSDTLSDALPVMHRGDRMSLTWRQGRQAPHHRATCPWPELCDGL